jgi:hypothetical protein
MSRALSPAFAAGAAAAPSSPGFLVEIAFSVPFRASSRGDLRFNGSPFNQWGFTVTGLSANATDSSLRGVLNINDLDRTVTAYVLTEGVAEKRVRVWEFYGDVASGTDIEAWNPLCVFDGYGDAVSIDPGKGRITITLMPAAGVVEYVPRMRITRENGFNWIPPKGKVIDFAGEKFTLDPEQG